MIRPRPPFLLSLLALVLPLALLAQAPFNIRPSDPAGIYRDIEKLGVLGTVLYVAAHPDDENTRLIAWFSRHRLTHTVYLSLTRGDGGQNLIGTEMNEMLGVLRTQELLAARRVDGGEQWFTRANDFGYSKTAEETIALWDKQAVLADVVWAIRKFRPDIIVNRFNAENSGSTHGHHTASAMLALEAFELAGDPQAFPEQLALVAPWQPKRIFFNTSWWFYGSQEAFDQADKSRMSQVDIGVYEPWSGYSNSEIAMKSRSMHRCQGFGAELYRGETMDYLDLLRGDTPPDPADPLSGLDLSWNRVPGGSALQAAIGRILRDYDFRDPAASLPALCALYRDIRAMPPHPWQERKLQELTAIVAGCAGLFLEAKTGQSAASPGTELTYSLEITQRAGTPITLTALRSTGMDGDTLLQAPLVLNQPWKRTHKARLAATLPYSAPYWLTQAPEGRAYKVDEQAMRGRPESPAPVGFRVSFELHGAAFSLEIPVVYKQIDPAFGERYQPLQVLPPATVSPLQPVALFPDGGTREIALKVRAGQDELQATVRPQLPEGWQARPDSQEVQIALQGDEKEVRFAITPPAGEQVADARFDISVRGQRYPFALQEVKYEHIPHQSVLQPATMRLVAVPLAGTRGAIGYIAGAGDQVPECLRDAGYPVTLLEDADLTAESLARFDAVIAGVRAYNTRDGLKFRQEALQQYVANGGTYLVQYNTNRGLVTAPSPLPLNVSRERVTDEAAPVRILAPDHPAMRQPNALRDSDFDGWVQERGLYFPDQWDPAFTPLLAAADPGEPESRGLLLVAPYGKGHYIYTGLSFFRQLPAGVPGAYRLLANLLALPKNDKP